MTLTYKNITVENDNLDYLYVAVKDYEDQINNSDIPLSEIITMVDEYLAGQIDVVDLLNDIQNELDWIPGERDVLQDAIDNVIPGLAIPANARAVLSGLADNQRRILQQNYRQLKVWKFLINNLTID